MCPAIIPSTDVENLSLGIPNTFGWTCSTVNIYHRDGHLTHLPFLNPDCVAPSPKSKNMIPPTPPKLPGGRPKMMPLTSHSAAFRRKSVFSRFLANGMAKNSATTVKRCVSASSTKPQKQISSERYVFAQKSQKTELRPNAIAKNTATPVSRCASARSTKPYF